MLFNLSRVLGWFGAGGALSDRKGTQIVAPSSALVSGTAAVGVDGALQLSTVWACVSLLANTIASLPLFVYGNDNGRRVLARDVLLWQLLHESPNSRMTPLEFWVAMILNLLLRGNAYARIERGTNGEAVALWPMPADQVEPKVLDDGSLVYLYWIDGNIAALASSSVLHIKGMGNGTVGLSRLDFMRASTTEASNAQACATSLFKNGGKPTGILMIDRVLKPGQREAIKQNFVEVSEGLASGLHVLEAELKYQQVNLTPLDQQLLETRAFGVEELCRWFGMPPVLVGHSNVTAWGSGIDSLIEGFYKFTLRPALVSIEQAVSKRVLTPAQRARYTVEFSLDALLRASAKDRFEIYSKAVNNGLKTRNECRQLENDPPIPGADELTAQTALAPLHMLGKFKPTGATNADTQSAIAQ